MTKSSCTICIDLTHWSLVMPYGDTELGRHWFRWWLGAWWHQAITWTNIDFSLVRLCGIHLKAISQPVSNLFPCYVIWHNTCWSSLVQKMAITITLREHHGISFHWPMNYLCNILLKWMNKKKITALQLFLYVGNPQGTGAFPTQRASKAGSVSTQWHHAWICPSGRQRERERLSLSAFLRTEDIGVHIPQEDRNIWKCESNTFVKDLGNKIGRSNNFPFWMLIILSKPKCITSTSIYTVKYSSLQYIQSNSMKEIN